MREHRLVFVLLIPILGAGGLARAGPIGNVSEVGSYSQIYQLNLLNDANYGSSDPAYSVDNSSTVIPGGIARVAYYLELDTSWIWVSMDAFEQDLSRIGVPTANSGAVFQQILNNLNVESNVGSIVTGTGIATGNIEFWPSGYAEGAGLGGIGGSSSLYDFNDTRVGNIYGSMQVHNYGAGQTLIGYNRWGRSDEMDDLGIGNSSGTHPDWTFEGTAADYGTKTLEVWVKPVPEPSTLLVLGLGVAGLAARGLRRRRKQLSN